MWSFTFYSKIKRAIFYCFSIYFAIIIIIEIIAVYIEKKTYNDTKICLQIFVLLAFPLYYCPKTEIILLLVCFYIVGITPEIYLNDFGFNDKNEYGNISCIQI